MSFCIELLTDIFHQLYNFMLDTEIAGVSLFAFWLGSIIVGISVSLILVVTHKSHG